MYYRRMCRIQPAVIFDVVLYLILYLYDSNMIQSLHSLLLWTWTNKEIRKQSQYEGNVVDQGCVSSPATLTLSVHSQLSGLGAVHESVVWGESQVTFLTLEINIKHDQYDHQHSLHPGSNI